MNQDSKTSVPRLILASASPRRQELLREAGYAFVVVPADIDESVYPAGLSPDELAEFLANAKADAIADRYPDDVILAADTVVAIGAKTLGKPTDADDARRMLRELGGTTHHVTTGVAVVQRCRSIALRSRVTSQVQMRRLTDDEIKAYVATNQWQGKAGGYGIQDADPFVTRMTGSHTNIVGLPMDEAARMLERAGVVPPTSEAAYRVGIVVDRTFGHRVADLSRQMHVWICKTPVNEAAARKTWEARPGYELESGVTCFDCTDDQSAEEMLVNIFGSVDEHHGRFSHDPPWTVIEVIGCDATKAVRQVCAHYEAETLTLGPAHFEAKRRLPSSARLA